MAATKPDTPMRATERGADAPAAQPGRSEPTTEPAAGHGPGQQLRRPAGAGDHRAAMAAGALDATIDAAWDAVVAAAPPLTEDARRRLAQLLGRATRLPHPRRSTGHDAHIDPSRPPGHDMNR